MENRIITIRDDDGDNLMFDAVDWGTTDNVPATVLMQALANDGHNEVAVFLNGNDVSRLRAALEPYDDPKREDTDPEVEEGMNFETRKDLILRMFEKALDDAGRWTSGVEYRYLVDFLDDAYATFENLEGDDELVVDELVDKAYERPKTYQERWASAEKAGTDSDEYKNLYRETVTQLEGRIRELEAEAEAEDEDEEDSHVEESSNVRAFADGNFKVGDRVWFLGKLGKVVNVPTTHGWQVPVEFDDRGYYNYINSDNLAFAYKGRTNRL